MKKYDFSTYFKNDSEFIHRSMVLYEGHHFYDFESISESYLKAAELILRALAEKADGNRMLDGDELLHPVVFLLRHSLETCLKKYLMVLIEHNNLVSFCPKVRASYACFDQHRLSPIAQAIWEIVSVKSIFQNPSFKNVIQFLEEFDQVDNNSTAFRYNINKDGSPQHVHSKQFWIDIFPFYEAVREICSEITKYTFSED